MSSILTHCLHSPSLSSDNLAELQAAHSATQASLRSMEASYSSATENERSYKLRLQGLEGEMSILKKDRDWNHEELLRVTDEAMKDRREKVRFHGIDKADTLAL